MWFWLSGCEHTPSTTVPCDPVAWFRDDDGDGFGGEPGPVACRPPDAGTWVEVSGDCDDGEPARFPGAPAACAFEDADCDRVVDAGHADADGDGVTACDGDCDDDDGEVLPGAVEVCNGKDDDCDGLEGPADPSVDPWSTSCGLCPPAARYPEFTKLQRVVNPCVLDPTVSLCRDGVTQVDTMEDGERVHTITVPTMEWGHRPQLLLYLPPGPGANTDLVSDWGAYAGFRLITLGWPNDDSINNACEHTGDALCWEGIRRERLYGEDASPYVEVAPNDSIVGRLQTLLTYLAATYPEEGWAEFLDGSGEVRWTRVVAGGWSEGGSMGAFLGKDHELAGVLLLGPGLDILGREGNRRLSDWWSYPSVTPPERVWTLYSFYDPQAWPTDWFPPAMVELGMTDAPVVVDTSAPPYGGSHLLAAKSMDFRRLNCSTHGAIAMDGCMDEDLMEDVYFHMYCQLPKTFPPP